MKKIAILIPCHNEELTIGKVIDAIPYERLQSLGYTVEVIVIDNNSTDKTAQKAKERNVFVIAEPIKGKGNAMMNGFKILRDDVTYVVMIDGDNTYKAQEIPRMIEPLESGFCDVVVGSRLGGKLKKGSLRFPNRTVNWTYTFLVRTLYLANITDVLSGYFAWKKEVIDTLKPYLKSAGFQLEMEMITKTVKLGYEIYSVPITYDLREGETKIEAINDGMKIAHTLFTNLMWKPKTKKISKKK